MKKICKNFLKKKFENAYFKIDIKKVKREDIKSLIIENPDIFEGVKPNKKQEIEYEIDEIIQTTINKIISKKNSLPSWTDEKEKIIQKAIIEMDKKSKSNLGSTDYNNVVNILVSYIENIPNFFDNCRTEKRINIIKDEIKENAKNIAKDYIDRKKEEEEKERKINEISKRYEEVEKRKRQAEIEAENLKKQRIQEEERRRKEEEEKRRIEQERIRIEEENRRRIEEENRRRREEEERRRREEEERRRREMYFPATPYGGCSIVDGLKTIGSDSSYGYRQRIAARNGIGGYVGSPAQNTHMLNLLKNGQLLRP